ncbi:MAG: hypothetical protein V4649_06310 [Bacteroidota bacterium]
MRKMLLTGLVAFASLASYAQSTKTKIKIKNKQQETVLPPPRVWIKGISSYNTTHDLLVANPLLVTDSPGCRPSGFTVSLQAPGHDFYGPLYSNTWEMTEIQKGVIKTWGAYKNVTLYIQDIHLNCHERDATSPPLTYYFNMEEENK